MADLAILALLLASAGYRCLHGCDFLIRQLIPISMEMEPTVAGNQSAIIDVVMHFADLCGTNVCCRKARETFATHLI